MLPPVLPRLATDSAVRVFPGVWECLSGAAIAPFRLWLPVTGGGWSAAS